MKRAFALATLAWMLAATLAAQAQPPRAGGSRGPRQPEPDDNAGFSAIFDGSSLKNWDGDPDFWRVEDGAIVGQSTAEKVLKRNTFVVWRGGTLGDFELRLDFRMTGGNSGVQYRSVELPDQGKWVLKGYQADMDADNRYTGMLYEERARGFLAERGRVTRITGAEPPRKLIASPGTSDELKAVIKPGEWNQIHIIAKGSTLIHIINGRVMSVCIDDDVQGRAAGGLLGLQLHQGPPMKVEFRNIQLKKL